MALPASTKGAEIAAFLSNAIRAQTLKAGAKLPTEEALCRQFGVSRTSVREAVSRLKADGLVRSRRGSGLFVAEPDQRRSFKVDEDLSGDLGAVLRILELRQPVEIAAARLAAARRSEEDLLRIREAHRMLMEAPEWSLDADLHFHHTIAVATQNVYYVDFMAFIGTVVGESIRVLHAGSTDPDVDAITIHEHERILWAIESEDPEAAGLAMQLHLLGARRRMGGAKSES